MLDILTNEFSFSRQISIRALENINYADDSLTKAIDYCLNHSRNTPPNKPPNSPEHKLPSSGPARHSVEPPNHNNHHVLNILNNTLPANSHLLDNNPEGLAKGM